MEIVLGVDNIIFISILTGRLPAHQQEKARIVGISLALLIRIALLFLLTWLIGLNKTLFTVYELDISGRDLIMIAGGLFLIYKSTSEVHQKLEGHEDSNETKDTLTFGTAIVQIILLDIVFSFDSILTAIGLVQNVTIMVLAVVIAMVVMLLSANKISEFIQQHPTIKMLALSFLLIIGILLLVEGFHVHVPKGYVYFAIFFSLLVEMLNIKVRKKTKPVNLKQKIKE
ncbi:MAG: membrane protein [Cyclobacteriaceae bacterium]|nr:MAG: membrane protein [Cyclobacteriaceae bacterium]